MQAYTYPITQALILFPLLALALLIPYLVYSYRRYRAISPLRSVILFSFLFYLLCAYFLVLLPLPSRESVAKLTTPWADLVPFSFVGRFLRGTVLNLRDPSTYLPALKQGVFLEPLLNVLLTVPFGMYLSYYFKKSFRQTVLFTFLLSLSFETLQLTGILGLYPRPYRLFEVNDLITNTTGGIIGYWFGRRVSAILPSRSQMDAASAERGLHVSYTRRAIATGVDMVLAGILGSLLGILIPLPTVASAIAYTLYFVVLQALWHGHTPGKRLVRIHTESESARRPFAVRLLLKYGPPYALYLLMLLARTLTEDTPSLALPVLLVSFLLLLVMALDWVVSFWRGKRLWYEVFSKTRNVNDAAQRKKRAKDGR